MVLVDIYCIMCGTRLIPTQGNNQGHACTNCGYKHYQNPTPVVAALLILEGNVAIVSSKNTKNKDLWGLPGGYIIPGESLEEALTRGYSKKLG